MARPAPADRRARDELVLRLREMLSDREPREVSMFGGIAFMVDGRMAVCARGDGGLLVRVAPDRYDDLLRRPGAQEPFMAERSMGRGWLCVDRTRLESRDELASWVDVGLDGRP